MSGKIYHGKSISSGVALGRLLLYINKKCPVDKRQIKNCAEETARLIQALQKLNDELKQLYELTLSEAGVKKAQIFNSHRSILKDAEFIDSVVQIINTDNVNAEYAVMKVCEKQVDLLSVGKDYYISSRKADIEDVTNRLINILGSKEESLKVPDCPAIIIAEDLSPGELMRLNSDNLLGLVLKRGTVGSHMSILAASKGIPVIIQADMELSLELHEREALLDGTEGLLYLEPGQEVISRFRADINAEGSDNNSNITDASQVSIQAGQTKLPGADCVKAGLNPAEGALPEWVKTKVYANISSVEEAKAAVKLKAGGIGLFRSEYLYLGRNDYPSEEEQYGVYKAVAEIMGNRKVILRTIDLGADKREDYLQLPSEVNPAMGCRAIRICFDRTDIFKAQLRAMYRAALYGNIAIMFPMIVSVSEIRRIKKLTDEVKAELKEEDIPYGEAELGIMIETPAAALISDLLASEADFFSIGTNDLIQFALAADRLNPKLNDIYNPHHPAILRLIRMVTENAHEKGITVGICGELAADYSLTETFLAYGIDVLSVSLSNLKPLIKKIKEVKAV